MSLSTIGANNHPGRIEPIYVMEKAPAEMEVNTPDRFRLILNLYDSGNVFINGNPVAFLNPSIFCINEKETFEEFSIKNNVVCLYFNPVFITPSMLFSVLREPPEKLPPEVLPNRLLIFPFISRKNSYNGVVNITETTAMRIQSLMKSMQKELCEQSSGWWPCRARGYLTELLFLVSQFTSTSFETKEQSIVNSSQEIMPLLSYLMSNYKKKITLNDLAKEFCINRTSLNNLIRKYTGYPAIAYLIKIRLRIAALLIKDTQLPLSEIIEKVGFDSLTYFGRIFKKNFKKTPTDFKKTYSVNFIKNLQEK